MSNTQYTDDVQLAQQLFEDSQPTTVTEWRNLPTEERRGFLIQAAKINDAKRRQEREAKALKDKLDATEAYRSTIAATTTESHLYAKLNAFMSGWDAALRHAEAARQ